MAEEKSFDSTRKIGHCVCWEVGAQKMPALCLRIAGMICLACIVDDGM